MSQYPKVKAPTLIGEYPALVKSGGRYVWDKVLEYRVWCHPENGALNIEDGDDYYYVFETYEEALKYSEENKGAEKPIALVLQEEYIDEPESINYVHVKEHRLTEWLVQLLSRPRRNANTVPEFVAPNAPDNRLEILGYLPSTAYNSTFVKAGVKNMISTMVHKRLKRAGQRWTILEWVLNLRVCARSKR